MRPERTEAIILNTFPARERDKLVVFLTPDHGKKKGWAYGARSLKSRFGAALEPLAKVRIAFLERESDEVVRIQSVDLVRSLDAMPDASKDRFIFLRADRAVPYGELMDVLEILRAGGYSKIKLVALEGVSDAAAQAPPAASSRP